MNNRRAASGRIAVASELVALRVDRSPVSGHLGLIVAEQGVPLKIACPLDGRETLPDE